MHQDYYFTADQGRELVDVLANAFDKVSEGTQSRCMLATAPQPVGKGHQKHGICAPTYLACMQIEAAVLLHGRLVDQNRFSHMLDGLPNVADRENVSGTGCVRGQKGRPSRWRHSLPLALVFSPSLPASVLPVVWCRYGIASPSPSASPPPCVPVWEASLIVGLAQQEAPWGLAHHQQQLHPSWHQGGGHWDQPALGLEGCLPALCQPLRLVGLVAQELCPSRVGGLSPLQQHNNQEQGRAWASRGLALVVLLPAQVQTYHTCHSSSSSLLGHQGDMA